MIVICCQPHILLSTVCFIELCEISCSFKWYGHICQWTFGWLCNFAKMHCSCAMSVLVIATSVVAIAAPETDCYWCKQSISHPYTKRTANTHHTEINVRRSGFSAKCRVQKSCHKLKSSANIERRMCISITLSRYPRSVCKQQQCTPYMTGEWVGLGMHYAWRTGTSSIAIVCGDASTTACFA